MGFKPEDGFILKNNPMQLPQERKMQGITFQWIIYCCYLQLLRMYFY